MLWASSEKQGRWLLTHILCGRILSVANPTDSVGITPNQAEAVFTCEQHARFGGGRICRLCQAVTGVIRSTTPSPKAGIDLD